jgi:hypothetical protein
MIINLKSDDDGAAPAATASLHVARSAPHEFRRQSLGKRRRRRASTTFGGGRKRAAALSGGEHWTVGHQKADVGEILPTQHACV